MARRVDELRGVFAPVVADVAGVFLFGSHATGSPHAGSDVDVCVVAGPDRAAEDVLRNVWAQVDLADAEYDVKVFETLPLFLQGRVLDEGVLVATRDEARLSEYLRPFRKVWGDQRHRARLTDADARRLLAARRRARS